MTLPNIYIQKPYLTIWTSTSFACVHLAEESKVPTNLYMSLHLCNNRKLWVKINGRLSRIICHQISHTLLNSWSEKTSWINVIFIQVRICVWKYKHTQIEKSRHFLCSRVQYSNTCRGGQLHQSPSAAPWTAVWLQENSLFSVGHKCLIVSVL